MTDNREKVINGLEHELQNRGKCGHYCRDGIETVSCEYDKDGLCIQHWGNDALALLKAQEPRVMTLEAVVALPDGSIVWLEDNDKPDVIVGLLRDVLLTVNDYIVIVIHFATVRNRLLEVVTAMADDYGIRWRCWTARPTDEQRDEVKWE